MKKKIIRLPAAQMYQVRRWFEEHYLEAGVKECQSDVSELAESIKTDLGLCCSTAGIRNVLNEFGLTTPRMRSVRRKKTETITPTTQPPTDVCTSLDKRIEKIERQVEIVLKRINAICIDLNIPLD